MFNNLKDHQIAELVNTLRDIAKEYHAHQCLRELISQEVLKTLRGDQKVINANSTPQRKNSMSLSELPYTDYYLGFCDEGGDHLIGQRGYTADQLLEQMNARREAQEQLYAERERYASELKKLQVEIGRLQALLQPTSDEPWESLADQTNPGWCIGCNPDNCIGCGNGLNENTASSEKVYPSLNAEDVEEVILHKPNRRNGVRLTHKPSGFSVTVDTERNQHRNKNLAWERLSEMVALNGYSHLSSQKGEE